MLPEETMPQCLKGSHHFPLHGLQSVCALQDQPPSIKRSPGDLTQRLRGWQTFVACKERGRRQTADGEETEVQKCYSSGKRKKYIGRKNGVKKTLRLSGSICNVSNRPDHMNPGWAFSGPKAESAQVSSGVIILVCKQPSCLPLSGKYKKTLLAK